jgi:hypothetical protein
MPKTRSDGYWERIIDKKLNTTEMVGKADDGYFRHIKISGTLSNWRPGILTVNFRPGCKACANDAEVFSDIMNLILDFVN